LNVTSVTIAYATFGNITNIEFISGIQVVVVIFIVVGVVVEEEEEILSGGRGRSSSSNYCS
jgi:hypothetical protein